MRRLYFKEKMFKITDHYPILDESSKTAYYIDQDFKLLGYRVKVSDKDKREVFTIDREIIALLPKYTVNFIDGKELIVQQRLALFGKKVEVYMVNDSLILNGDLWGLNFQILDSKSNLIGDVKKKFVALTDTFELTVYNEDYEHELIALVLSVNNLLDRDAGRSS